MDKIRTEVRENEHGIDEVLLWVDDKCVFHLETMSEQAMWFSVGERSFWINSKNGKSHIQIKEQ